VKVFWVRYNDEVSFNNPCIWFVLGLRGSGKSSFLEHLGENYLYEGNIVFDLFGSRDGENLAWLRSPYVNDKRILLLRGENVDVNCSFPVIQADKFTLHDLERNDIIISSSPLYLNMDQEFYYAAKLTDLLYKRMYWRRLVYVIVREAANFYYSRLRVSENQVIAKSQMIYLVREARHCGLSLGLDSIRYYAIDIDIRNLTDYLILKAQGTIGLTEDLKWLYKYFSPTAMQKMPQKYFVIVSKSGALGFGSFPYPEWHKREGENILKIVDIKVEYGEAAEEAEYRGKNKTVSDREHAEIIRLYLEELLSMEKIARKLKHSSRTIMQHINSHDMAVERSGFCPACKRVQSLYQEINVKREREKLKGRL